MNKLADMSTFVAVVEAGSLTQAARRVGTTKSVVSERIRQLESRLGTSLVERARKERACSMTFVVAHEPDRDATRSAERF